MENIRIIFFGSTSDSVLVLEALANSQLTTYLPRRQAGNVQLVAVVTQPPRPVGRTHAVTPTPVETWAKHHNVTVLSFSSDPEKPWLYADENQVIDTLQPMKADLFISASYGQRIPMQAIQAASFGGLNIHPSLLPRWRGADPVPWAILSGDRQTGVTVVTLSQTFDQGHIIAQKKIPLTDRDTSDPLRTKLFTLGADLLIQSLPQYLANSNPGIRKVNSGNRSNNSQLTTNNLQPLYARKLTRDDGYITWDEFISAEYGNQTKLDRKVRALSPWPGVWTKTAQGKRLKIISLKPTRMVQLEGKKSVSFDQFEKAYLSHIPS